MAQGPPDAELVRRVRDADGAALSQLYQRFVRPCYSLARRIWADEKLAEDVAQEVFLTLWRDPSRYDPARGGFATWLLTVIHHRAVDAVRRESTGKAVPSSSARSLRGWPNWMASRWVKCGGCGCG
jgi:DNA-directed RNA polymerase specialized sigma24 family protein